MEFLAFLSAVGLSKHLRDNQNLLKPGACLIKVHFSVFSSLVTVYMLVQYGWLS